METTKDYFSKQSDFYAKYRPKYPEELFEYLISLCKSKDLEWDCATGNGQAAISLSNYFKKIVATDFSNNQLSNAFQRVNIEYRLEKAEESTLETNSVDLITVATAIHWFNIPQFYKQTDRVLKPGGVLAVWGYGGCRVSTQLDEILNRFNFETLNNYWPPETKMNWIDNYRNLPFPYPLLGTPKFIATANYTFYDLLNYMLSWSGVQQYIKKHDQNPIDLVSEELKTKWGNPSDSKMVYWDLFLKCGYKP